jgi:hypothetical protein
MTKPLPLFCLTGAALLAACTDEPHRVGRFMALPTVTGWAAQDQATNVQDWQRMSGKIVDGLQSHGLLSSVSIAPGAPAATGPFYISATQNTPFVREIGRAVRNEIIRRGGIVVTSPAGAYVVDLRADVINWGSRAVSNPYRERTEGIWNASIHSGGRVLMEIQEPFHTYASDIPQYVELPSPELQPARDIRPLRYAP